MITNIARNKAGVVSRFADFLQFITNPFKTNEVAGERPIGGVSATQTSKGVFYPTVQSAIDDLSGRCDLEINSVIVNTDGIVPGFVNQSDQIKFSGTVIGTGTKMIYVLGFPVIIDSSDTPEIIATKAEAVLIEAVINSIAIKSVSVDNTDASILNITYNDYQNHVFEEDVQHGVKITQTTVVSPRAGYGNWERLGTQSVTLTGGTVNGTITLYYFQRVS
ncbi:baseplate wedge subunit [Pectobacterium bacteriophage PM2]|uniref:Baseplate wedge subunit and tail pin n=1 Tax=Pectobacterium bacteriophage PM2 TaxID=1429794 RepID=A0A0A0Q3J4_9CAUD|nr:baseplate wedge subunit [Pectobacterium bacteriophage PM2]AHY25142.1 baseplate wedge subunit and tail pin [Pectobacterium bacteriophage PM2]